MRIIAGRFGAPFHDAIGNDSGRLGIHAHGFEKRLDRVVVRFVQIEFAVLILNRHLHRDLVVGDGVGNAVDPPALIDARVVKSKNRARRQPRPDRFRDGHARVRGARHEPR